MNGKEREAGGRIIRGIIVILVGVIIWFLPVPAGVKPEAWHLLAIFVATIVGLILTPLPMGAVVIIGVMMTTLTGVLKIGPALSGFANNTVWLIVAAFLVARGFISTGLGRRVAFVFIRAFGRKTLGLAYAIVASELVISPATPSNTARAGGIIYPIVRSLAQTFGSEPGETARKIGAFLMMMEFQATVITSAMFMTSMAPNPLIAELAQKTARVSITWGMWALAAIVPGILSLIIVPYLLYKIYPPEIKETPEAAEMAHRELEKMGPMKRTEKIMLFVFLLILALWVTGEWSKIDATVVAFVGVGVMLVTGVIRWDDVLTEKGAWDALIWFGGLVMMASQLNSLGFMKWFATTVGSSLAGWPWFSALIVLMLVYFYSHYGFASTTAHVTAMFPAFLAVAVAVNVPPYLAALTLGFFSALNAGITHYGTGPAPIYFNAGYMDQKTWWKFGLIVSFVNIAIWMGAGFPWWKVLGLW
ncbi:MAG: anion transporter family protein [Deltaproteobacteria bacterium]|nr:anion transporter family protein [Deltaproteobacteria bacterium]